MYLRAVLASPDCKARTAQTSVEAIAIIGGARQPLKVAFAAHTPSFTLAQLREGNLDGFTLVAKASLFRAKRLTIIR